MNNYSSNKESISMNNSVACTTLFQNYSDRKFCTRSHITNRIFYIKIIISKVTKFN